MFKSTISAEAEARMQRFFQAANMNPKGFRTPSKKNGAAREMTYPDRLVFAVVGKIALPRAHQSDRKRQKRERFEFYAEKVRNNPQYPTGDRRSR